MTIHLRFFPWCTCPAEKRAIPFFPLQGAWPKEYGETSFALGERDEIDAKAAKIWGAHD
jgi:hypothetical protein